MDNKLSSATHLVTGYSAASTMRVAFRIPREQVIVNEDPISCGPTPATTDMAEWRAVREEFFYNLYRDCPDISFTENAECELMSNISRLCDAESVYIWAAAGLSDQLTVAFAVTLLKQSKKDFNKVFIVPVDLPLSSGGKVRGLGEINIDQWRKLDRTPRLLRQTEIKDYSDAWNAYTSINPEALVQFISHNHDSQMLVEAMHTLINRYPARNSGLSKLDEQLLHMTKTKGRKAARIVGNTMAWNDSLDRHGDQYVFHRLRQLGNPSLVSPLVVLVGDLACMRRCEAELTEFGNQVLLGFANALDTNGIDDFIGGVLLTNRSHTPLRHNGKLHFP